ncbi:MAG: endonuclease/exonuclease/phosphatase family protein [Saprospiraceae bacterium]|nr:endonuclease/exonuclease/phosphatase family protein [Saprospiraceae bacterium]
MPQKILAHPLAHIAITFLVVFGIFVCVFPQVFSPLSWVVNYAVQLMLLYLLGGLALLFLKQPRLTFICFGGCLFLAFYLKFSIKNNYIDRWRNAILEDYTPNESKAIVKVGLFNLSNGNDQVFLAKTLRECGADVISIHEVTPAWVNWLEDSLKQTYPYHHSLVDIGLFGMALYSKFPMTSIDTFYYEDIPNLRACFKDNGSDFCLVSVHTEPALNELGNQKLKRHLEALANQITHMEGIPLMVVGDFNAVSWSTELQQFMETAGLMQSRNGFMDIQRTIGYVPIDHIFHSPRFVCSDFNNFSGINGQHLGITSTFQLNQLASYVKKTAQ